MQVWFLLWGRFQFFNLQGRQVASITVKFGREEGTVKLHLDWLRGCGFTAPKTENFGILPVSPKVAVWLCGNTLALAYQ